MSKRDEFVAVAQSQVGVREQGINNVKYNDWYYGRHVEGSGYPWCDVFVSWCANEVGILDNLVPKKADCYVCGNSLIWSEWVKDLTDQFKKNKEN